MFNVSTATDDIHYKQIVWLWKCLRFLLAEHVAKILGNNRRGHSVTNFRFICNFRFDGHCYNRPITSEVYFWIFRERCRLWKKTAKVKTRKWFSDRRRVGRTEYCTIFLFKRNLLMPGCCMMPLHIKSQEDDPLYILLAAND